MNTSQINNEALFIADRLHNKYGVTVRIASALPTPDFYFYRLETHPDYRVGVAQLRAVSRNLANDIYVQRGDGERVIVSVNDQPLQLQVSRPDRQPLPWSVRPKVTDPHIATLGAFWQTAKGQTIKIDLTNTNTFSIGFLGSSGSGKSMAMYGPLLQLIENTDPTCTEFYFADVDSNQFDCLRGLPHVRYVAETDAQSADMLHYLRELVEADRELTNPIRRFIVIDEAHLLTAMSEHADRIIDDLTVIATTGRKKKYNLLIALQDPSKATLPMSILRQLKVMVVGCTSPDTFLRSQLQIEGASKLRGNGDMICVLNGEQIRFKSFFLSEQDKFSAISRIARRWGTDNNTMVFAKKQSKRQVVDVAPEVVEVEPMVSAKEQKLMDDAKKIAPQLSQAWDFERGELINGWGVRLIECIYGEPKQCAGNYKARLDAAIQYALSNFDLTNERTNTKINPLAMEWTVKE